LSKSYSVLCIVEKRFSITTIVEKPDVRIPTCQSNTEGFSNEYFHTFIHPTV
jgi:hypothetical protein